MSDVKHQVFVSSTFLDLKEERREVMQALLELDCIPAGMELFPASDDASWTLIRRVIDQCDYYVVIVGNRYGSVANDGLSFTEKEYDYAVSVGIPVLGFVPETPDDIPIGKSETDKKKRAQLDKFRKKVLGRNCKHYNGPEDLGSKVSRSLITAMKSHPRPGWVRAGKAGDPNLTERLRKEIEELREQLTAAREQPPAGADALAQGAEVFEAEYSFYDARHDRWSIEAEISWDQIFATIGPCLMHEATEKAMRDTLNEQLLPSYAMQFLEDQDYSDTRVREVKVESESFDTIKIQLSALGLIKISEAKRKIGDRSTYWCLTPYGATYLTRLRAVRRS